MIAMNERRRVIEEPHVRSIQLQTLDALLRIEELLQPRSAPYIAAADEVLDTKPGGVTKTKVRR